MINTEKIDKILNTFLEEFNAIAELGEEFECFHQENNIIKYALVVNTDEDKWFQDSLLSIDSDIVCDPFLAGFFHELGHIMTKDKFTENDWDDYFEIVEELCKNTEKSLYDLNLQYFQLPVERAASEWACWYMREHADKVSQFWAELQPAIINFYKENNVIVDLLASM